jgi:hypothetical protein
MTAPFWPLYCDFREGVDARVVPTRVGSGTVFTTQGRWREVPGDTLRRTAPDGALLMGAGGTNLVANPRQDGAALGMLGAGGSAPTGYVVTAPGLSIEFLGFASYDGVPCGRYRFSGTPSATTGISFSPEPLTGASGLPYAYGGWVGAVGGSNANLSSTAALRLGAQSFGRFLLSYSQLQTVQRWAQVLTLTEGSSVHPLFRWVHNNTTDPVDITLAFGWFATAQQDFVSNPILPPIGAPAASTIGADSATMLLRDFAIAPADAGLMLVAFRAAPGINATAQPIASISDGTTGNRALITRETNRTIRAEVFVGGVSRGSVTSVATVADNAAGLVALRYGPGDLALSLNGAVAVRTVPTGTLPPLTHVDLLGHDGATVRVAFRPEREPQRPLNAISQTLARQGPGAGGLT